MNHWHHFLQGQGATLNQDNSISFSTSPADYPALLKQATMTPLIHLGVLSIQGPDAKKFIQGQVTCDVEQLSQDHCLMGARCNLKGRALSSFYLVQLSDEHLLMIMDRSLVQTSIDELSKYAAFFKVELSQASDTDSNSDANTDSSNHYQCIGLSAASVNLPDSMAFTANVSLGNHRRLLILTTEQAELAWEALQQPELECQATGTEFWQLQDIQSGIAMIQPETSAMFVPQMFNLQAVDGISFKKGCYTGQEVVARMKYLGKLKRRMYRIEYQAQEPIQKLPEPGENCQLDEESQNIGNLVIAVNSDTNTQEMLVVLTEEAAKSTTLLIDGTRYEGIKQLPLPYEI